MPILYPAAEHLVYPDHPEGTYVDPIRNEDGSLVYATRLPYQTHVGRVLADRERNGRDDSDFYAVVYFDPTPQFPLGLVTDVVYDSTRHGGYSGGRARAVVDATPEVREAADKYLVSCALTRLLEADEAKAKTVAIGKRVRVVRGRKVPLGTEGEVFYMNTRDYAPRYRNSYSSRRPPDSIRCGIDPTGRRDGRNRADAVFTDARNLEVLEWEQYLTPIAELRRRAQQSAGCYAVVMPGYAVL